MPLISLSRLIQDKKNSMVTGTCTTDRSMTDDKSFGRMARLLLRSGGENAAQQGVRTGVHRRWQPAPEVWRGGGAAARADQPRPHARSPGARAVGAPTVLQGEAREGDALQGERHSVPLPHPAPLRQPD